jgi:hypothetical protein
LRWDGAKKSSFTLFLVGFALGLVKVCLKELYMWSYFAKQFIKMTLAPPIELFIELKQKKLTSLVKWIYT